MTPLPEPVSGRCKSCNQTGLSHCSDPVHCGGMEFHYTEDQMRAYGAAEYKRAIEAAAALCDGQAHEWKENPFVTSCGGYVAASNCAFNIRKLGENHEHSNSN